MLRILPAAAATARESPWCWAAIFAIECACSRETVGPSVPPVLVLPVSPASTEASARSVPAASQVFAPVRDQVMGELFADDPTNARDLGLHEYDGKVAPISKEALSGRVGRLTQAAVELARIDRAALSDDEALDLAELEGQVASALFWLVDLDAPRKYPQFYEPLFSVNTFLDRNYAPIDERAKRLVAHEEAALEQVAHVRGNLTPPLSKPVAEVAARNFAGFATYLRGDVAKVMGNVGDDAQRARFAKANQALSAAAGELAASLKNEAAPGEQSH